MQICLKKTLKLILHVCWQEGKILNFSDMLHDLYHISNEILFIHNFIFFCSNNTHFVIKHVLKFKYQPGHLKVKCNTFGARFT